MSEFLVDKLDESKLKEVKTIVTGNNNLSVGDLLPVGFNEIQITCSDIYSNTKTLTYSVTHKARLIDADAYGISGYGEYYYVADFFDDKEKAKTVRSGYIPDVDKVLASKKGICFDYASLMTGMLRSQGVPCKMIFGYAGSAYHAWISTYTEKSGWVEGVIFFDGTTWKLMDPTFASSSNSSDAIMKYIGDGKNYSEKYLY